MEGLGTFGPVLAALLSDRDEWRGHPQGCPVPAAQGKESSEARLRVERGKAPPDHHLTRLGADKRPHLLKERG